MPGRNLGQVQRGLHPAWLCLPILWVARPSPDGPESAQNWHRAGLCAQEPWEVIDPANRGSPAWTTCQGLPAASPTPRGCCIPLCLPPWEGAGAWLWGSILAARRPLPELAQLEPLSSKAPAYSFGARSPPREACTPSRCRPLSRTPPCRLPPRTVATRRHARPPPVYREGA